MVRHTEELSPPPVADYSTNHNLLRQSFETICKERGYDPTALEEDFNFQDSGLEMPCHTTQSEPTTEVN
jgi:hypothetical protein